METTPSNSAREFYSEHRWSKCVAHQTVLIISDNSDFAGAITAKWPSERNLPTFLTNHLNLQPDSFDLAIIGTTNASVFDLVQSFARPAIHVSRMNGKASKLSRVIHIPEVDGWPELVITVAKQILEREKIASDFAQLSEARSQLEREASLGRYMLEMRHNLNNALTSILGNSELLLMDDQSLSPSLRLQLETIRNMGMRMNEILQRFTSLQKEMQLVEQQSWNKAAKSVGAGV
jgi:signal transduction histidine kinase